MKMRWVPLGAAALVPAVLFLLLPPLGYAGLWDPHELRVADLARGHVDADAQPPLPLWSIALGFKIFGVHDWSGRLPLALWGLAGALFTYAWVARLVDRRAGAYAAIALATMPLYFVQARTMLGGIVGMSAVTASFGALAVACFDASARRWAWLLVAAVALAAGLFGAGALLGVALPAAAVGGAWAIARLSRARAFDRVADGVGIASLGVGLAVAIVAMRKHDAHAALWLGGVPAVAANTSFTHVLSRLGHALAPWSAFAPLALGRLFVAPPVENQAARERESALRVALLVAAGAALAAHTWLATVGIDVPFVAPAILAAAAAITLFDFERGAPPSIALGAGTAVLLGVLLVDFR
jgi:4-amino-4-deoxy-L-arabinose transferase-like glycosyltransferase